jgi:curved DNA-binding protein CbpA
MDHLTHLIQRFLGRAISSESLNHYSLLGIEPDASVEQIKSALRTAAAAWNASDTRSSPQDAQQVAQLLKQAQSTLLDVNKRRIYDESILEAANRFKDARSDLESEPMVLPEGDPLTAFDPTAFRPLRTPSKFGDPESRWRALEATVFAGEDPNRLAPTASVSLDQSSFARTSPETNGQRQGDNPQSAAMRIKQLRKKRQRNQSLILGGILLAAVTFLGFASIRFFLNRQNLADAKKTDVSSTKTLDTAVLDGKNNVSTDSKSESKSPVRSNLPSVSKENEEVNTNGFGETIPPTSDIAMNMQPVEQKTAPTETTPLPINKESMAEEKNAMPEKPTTPAAMPEPVVMPDMKTLLQWQKAMNEGKAALQNLDFDTFGKSMEQASMISVGDEQTAKQKRLDQFGQLYRIAIEAMKEARSKTRGADVITVGKNRISIVEVKTDSVIVRVSGESKTYLWSEVPMGIALGFLDLTLSDTDPTDLAARAVYLSFSSAKTDLYDKRIKEFFEKSLGKGDIRQDLPQALTDSYE